jgi:steroid 5-alpha reductase family enzyme
MSTNRENLTAPLGILAALIIAAVLVFTLSGETGGTASPRVLAMVIGLAFAIQWVAFVPAWLMKTESFYDLVGGSSFILVSAFCLYLAPSVDLRSGLLFAMVLLWGGRLSTFLFLRIRKSGSDQRFDEIKQSFPRFLFAWTAQGLWVAFSLAPVFVAFLQPTGRVDAFLVLGAAVWLFGYSFEVIADWQKTQFKKNPKNEGQFINSGLWARSRHPNYFGEIVLWTGIALIAFPTLSGSQLIALASPVFVFVLLYYVSGVPMLEKRADAKWGHLDAYQAYKKGTPILIPRIRAKD